ncbi:MAG TPA: hypothetical protein VGU71_02195 [Candidatus Dormibacteraeota bacterium]|nr:hypothetical protein [Candidatus Dormibacteraeota bacterium]
MSDLSHLWQRFLLTSALLVGIAIGATATIFGASNQASVNVSWWVFHLNGVPLWAVAVVPLAVVLVAGTLYHWVDGLHHFTEHMRHRRRVHELEAEVVSLRAHLDQVLEMPDHSTSRLPEKPPSPLGGEGLGVGRTSAPSLPAADEEIADAVSDEVVPVEAIKPAPATIEAAPVVESPAKPAAGAVVAVAVEKAPATRKGGHGASHRRATLTVAAENGEPDRLGSHAEGIAAGGKAPKSAARPAPEV